MEDGLGGGGVKREQNLKKTGFNRRRCLVTVILNGKSDQASTSSTRGLRGEWSQLWYTTKTIIINTPPPQPI